MKSGISTNGNSGRVVLATGDASKTAGSVMLSTGSGAASGTIALSTGDATDAGTPGDVVVSPGSASGADGGRSGSIVLQANAHEDLLAGSAGDGGRLRMSGSHMDVEAGKVDIKASSHDVDPLDGHGLSLSTSSSSMLLRTGDSQDSNEAGSLDLRAGSSSSSTGGSVRIASGSGGGAAGGDVSLQAQQGVGGDQRGGGRVLSLIHI